MKASGIMQTFSPWLDRGPELRASFETAEPFPLVVIDDFLVPELAEALEADFPTLDAMPRSRDYVFGEKRELSSIENRPAGRAFREGVLSEEFRRFLSEVSGYDVFVDPDFHGGGFHQGGDGSYLDMHVDFNVHPLHPDWMRTLNVLLYLNRDWAPEYGGELLVKSHPDEEPRTVAPLFNRAVVMLTSDFTYHGYPTMSVPPGVTRKSIATYAYRSVDPGSVRARTTGWVPETGSLPKRLLARYYGPLVRIKNRLFGSGTARNR